MKCRFAMSSFLIKVTIEIRSLIDGIFDVEVFGVACLRHENSDETVKDSFLIPGASRWSCRHSTLDRRRAIEDFDTKGLE